MEIHADFFESSCLDGRQNILSRRFRDRYEHWLAVALKSLPGAVTNLLSRRRLHAGAHLALPRPTGPNHFAQFL